MKTETNNLIKALIKHSGFSDLGCKECKRIVETALVDAYNKGVKIKKDECIVSVAKLLCEQWDDDWALGKKLYMKNAQDIINMIDEFEKLQPMRKEK